MKKMLFSLLALIALSCSPSFATVHTLCNMPYSPGQYTTFSAAHNAASNGDTIYVHGSNFSYGSISIYKPLVIIGTGHHPNKQMPMVSTFESISVQSSGVQVIGVKCHTINSRDYANGAIKKCRIENATGGFPITLRNSENWLVEGNVIEIHSPFAGIYFGSNSANNTIVQHNIFISLDGNTSVFALLSNGPTQLTYFLNNTIIGTACVAFATISYARIDNNILYGCDPGNYTEYCSMNNNISFNCTDNNFYAPGANNLINQDPRFVSFSGTGLFNYADDFHLAPDSPGLNNGTDGTDRGVYGGLGSKFTMTGEPSIAEITSFTITSPTVIAPGGNLTISIDSKRIH